MGLIIILAISNARPFCSSIASPGSLQVTWPVGCYERCVRADATTGFAWQFWRRWRGAGWVGDIKSWWDTEMHYKYPFLEINLAVCQKNWEDTCNFWECGFIICVSQYHDMLAILVINKWFWRSWLVPRIVDYCGGVSVIGLSTLLRWDTRAFASWSSPCWICSIGVKKHPVQYLSWRFWRCCFCGSWCLCLVRLQWRCSCCIHEKRGCNQQPWPHLLSAG